MTKLLTLKQTQSYLENLGIRYHVETLRRFTKLGILLCIPSSGGSNRILIKEININKFIKSYVMHELN